MTARGQSRIGAAMTVAAVILGAAIAAAGGVLFFTSRTQPLSVPAQGPVPSASPESELRDAVIRAAPRPPAAAPEPQQARVTAQPAAIAEPAPAASAAGTASPATPEPPAARTPAPPASDAQQPQARAPRRQPTPEPSVPETREFVFER